MIIEQPTMLCPRCGTEYEDYDGLGVLHCERCGYCKHPSASFENKIMTCDICGEVLFNKN